MAKAEVTVEEAVSQAHTDARAFVTMIARFVPYRDFYLMEKPDGSGKEVVPVDTFRATLGIAIYDIFSGLPEEKKAAKLGLDKDGAARFRSHPVYSKIRQALMDKAAELAIPRSYDQWAEIAEDLLSRDQMRAVVVSKDSKTKMMAAKEMLDRRSAKKGREVQQAVLLIPERMFHELEAGMKALTGLPTGDDETIDAAVLNVPKLIGSGST